MLCKYSDGWKRNLRIKIRKSVEHVPSRAKSTIRKKRSGDRGEELGGETNERWRQLRNKGRFFTFANFAAHSAVSNLYRIYYFIYMLYKL